MADEEQVHVYFRDPKGRIVTHFLVPKGQWLQWNMAAQHLHMTVDEFVAEAIRQQFKAMGLEHAEAKEHG